MGLAFIFHITAKPIGRPILWVGVIRPKGRRFCENNGVCRKEFRLKPRSPRSGFRLAVDGDIIAELLKFINYFKV